MAELAKSTFLQMTIEFGVSVLESCGGVAVVGAFVGLRRGGRAAMPRAAPAP
ncbi:hypothetical protein [Nonomuraea angiospora]|uniref:hypothetical protein n=1 Tax=Nonomuraea TaxID=83681 RepID=UPI00331A8AA1